MQKGMDYTKMTPLLVEAANALRQTFQIKFILSLKATSPIDAPKFVT